MSMPTGKIWNAYKEDAKKIRCLLAPYVKIAYNQLRVSIGWVLEVSRVPPLLAMS